MLVVARESDVAIGSSSSLPDAGVMATSPPKMFAELSRYDFVALVMRLRLNSDVSSQRGQSDA
jgi:hypothetical protein